MKAIKFTLISFLIAVPIVMVLMYIALGPGAFSLKKYKVQLRFNDTRNRATNLIMAMEKYRRANGTLPTSVKEITASGLTIECMDLSFLSNVTNKEQERLFIDEWFSLTPSRCFVYIKENRNFMLLSPGPDRQIDADLGKSVSELKRSVEYFYDPTNGSISRGDIMLFSEVSLN